MAGPGRQIHVVGLDRPAHLSPFQAARLRRQYILRAKRASWQGQATLTLEPLLQ